MDAGWTRGSSSSMGSISRSASSSGFQGPRSAKVDVVIIADDARVPMDGCGRGRTAAGRRRRRSGGPSTPITLTADDLARFEQFIRGGGTVVCLSNASTFAIQQFKLPVKNVVAGLRPEEFFLRGSIVEVATDPTHPVMAGMPEKAAVFVDGSPVFETEEGFTGTVLARYQESGSPLLSGYLIGEKIPERQGRGARRPARRRPRRCCSASGRSGAVSRSARSRCCSMRRCWRRPRPDRRPPRGDSQTGEVDESPLRVRSDEANPHLIADVEAFESLLESTLDRHLHQPDPGALWPGARDDRIEHLTDSIRQPQRCRRLPRERARPCWRRPPVSCSVPRGWTAGSDRRLPSGINRSLQESLRNQIGKPSIGRGGVRVAAGRQGEMRARVTRTLGDVFAASE